jgi:hypothetical protein
MDGFVTKTVSLRKDAELAGSNDREPSQPNSLRYTAEIAARLRLFLLENNTGHNRSLLTPSFMGYNARTAGRALVLSPAW